MPGTDLRGDPPGPVLRTPPARFRQLPDFSFQPHYLLIRDRRFGQLRMHYLDEGPRHGPVMLLLHGQGCWAYMYRKVIPGLVAAGYRVVAPDYVGFGRSDKLAVAEYYSFQDHIDWLIAFLSAMRLPDVTAFMFDWGGFFGLRIAAERPEFFNRLVLSNTMLPRGMPQGREWFIKWRAQQLALPRFPQGEMVAEGVVQPLAPETIAAYDAPYPDESYKAAPRRFPLILPIDPEDPAAQANQRAWELLAGWDRPVLTVYSASRSAMGPEALIGHLPGARGQAHLRVEDASFYIVEDQPAIITAQLVRFAGESRTR